MATQTGTIQPFNFSKAATRIKPMPDGTYELVFVKHDMKTVASGDNAGAPMFVAQMKPYGEFHPKYATRTLFRNIPLIAPDEDAGVRGTYWVMNQFLEALGLSEDEMSEFNFDTISAYYGRRLQGDVTTRTWEQEERNEVNKFKLSTGQLPDGAPSDESSDEGEDRPARSRLR